MNTHLELALKLAALTHLGLVAAGALMPCATGLWSECAKLAPFPRTLFRVYYAFIGLCLFSFGLGSWIFARELASGSPLAPPSGRSAGLRRCCSTSRRIW